MTPPPVGTSTGSSPPNPAGSSGTPEPSVPPAPTDPPGPAIESTETPAESTPIPAGPIPAVPIGADPVPAVPAGPVPTTTPVPADPITADPAGPDPTPTPVPAGPEGSSEPPPGIAAATTSTAAAAGAAAAPAPVPRSYFRLCLTAVAIVAGGIQVLFIHAMSRRTALPAVGRYDTVQAHYLVRGQWFVDPVQATSGAHLFVPTAAHPPLPTLLLGIADVASATGSTQHMVFLAMLFVASVVLAGITVRDLVGERAGVLAALVFATFPLLWVNPATIGPETTVIAVTTLLLFASVRFWARPSSGHAALVGLALGLCALTRTDLVALVVLVGLPLGLSVRSVPWKVRLRGLAVMGVIALLVVGPWVGRNLSQFGHTVILSEDYGAVVAGANCATTASGQLEGWWSPACLARVPVSGQPASVTTADQVHVGRVYVSDHLGSTVGVAAVRLGRLWNVYRPLQGSDLEVATGRPAWVSRLGLWYFYLLVPAAAVGAVVLRRRRLLLFPFLALILLSSITAVLAFGDARFAVEADVAMAMLAGVALDVLATRVRSRWSSPPGRHSMRRFPAAP